MPKESKNKDKKVKAVKDKKHFLKDTKAELKKVIWPTPKQLFNSTLAVITIVVVVAVIVFILDICFEKINNYGINKLKTVVQSTQVDESSTENSVELNVTTDNSTAELTTQDETSNVVTDTNKADETTNNAE